MEVQKYIEIVGQKKGANLRAVWERPMKVRKSAGDVTITKMTSAVVRGGIDYDNIKTVQEGRENGEKPAENAGLTWGEWVEFPFHIAHKGNDYLRLYPASGIEFTPNVVYFMNGKEVKKDEIESLCLASEFKVNEKKPECFTIKAENLITIG